MQGTLIVNAFWDSPSVSEMTRQLQAAARDMGMALAVKTNADFLCLLPGPRPLGRETPGDFVLFWDKDIRLARLLEMRGARLFNSARAIALCDDKTLTHLALCQAGLPMPDTLLCPQTFPGNGYPRTDFLDQAGEALGYPLVIKEGCGSFGQQVYLVQNRAEAEALLRARAGTPLLLQRFIRESAGQDLRLYMVGQKCVGAMRRSNDGDFRANIQHGGHGRPYTPTAEQIALATRACRALGLDFAGVDLLESREGPLLCEVNSNAHFTALSALTGAPVAREILALIRDTLRGNCAPE